VILKTYLLRAADFTLDNITLSGNYELRGLFDFARAGPGTLAEELSPLATIDEAVLAGCLRELAAAGLAPAPEEVWLWRHMKDLHVLPFWIARNQTDAPIYHKMRGTITARYPHLDWSELYR